MESALGGLQDLGLKLVDGENPRNLEYTDDVVWLFESPGHMQREMSVNIREMSSENTAEG